MSSLLYGRAEFAHFAASTRASDDWLEYRSVDLEDRLQDTFRQSADLVAPMTR